MESKTSLVPEDRKILLADYEADIQRRLDLLAGSADGALGARESINRLLVSEIAQLKLQITELEMASFRSDPQDHSEQLRPSIDHIWPSMPTYDIGSQISLAAGIVTFGFHFPEFNAGGTAQRWSGPSTRSGLVALINRAEPLLCLMPNISFIDPSVEISSVLIDGERVKHEWPNERLLTFIIPAIRNSDTPVPTQITFLVNKCFVVKDVRPGNLDTRRVGFCAVDIHLKSASTQNSGN